MGRRKFHISKELMFFFFFYGLPACPFLSQGPWTHIHESMIVHVCLLGLCLLSCSCRVAAACPMLLNSAGGFKSNLQVATKDSQIETGRGLSDVLKSIAFPRPVYIVLKLLHGCVD